MPLTEILILFPLAVLGGALNSVAGGGTFFVFPALLWTGMSPIAANATTTMALWPGSISSVFAYRKEVFIHRERIPQLIAISFVGGLAGALVLLNTPEQTFEFLIPYLLLTATVLFAVSPRITRYFRNPNATQIRKLGIAAGALFQFTIAFYGGYFGAGIGILMLAMLGLMGLQDIHEMNALKTLLGASINGIAVVTFILSGVIVWPQALLMLVGAVIGGYFGAHYSKKLPQIWVRRGVIVTGCCLTVLFLLG